MFEACRRVYVYLPRPQQTLFSFSFKMSGQNLHQKSSFTSEKLCNVKSILHIFNFLYLSGKIKWKNYFYSDAANWIFPKIIKTVDQKAKLENISPFYKDICGQISSDVYLVLGMKSDTESSDGI